jgi:hypothetical protein
MNWDTFVLVGIGSAIPFLWMGEAVWYLAWLALLYGSLNSSLDWRVVAAVFVIYVLRVYFLKQVMRFSRQAVGGHH